MIWWMASSNVKDWIEKSHSTAGEIARWTSHPILSPQKYHLRGVMDIFFLCWIPFHWKHNFGHLLKTALKSSIPTGQPFASQPHLKEATLLQISHHGLEETGLDSTLFGPCAHATDLENDEVYKLKRTRTKYGEGLYFHVFMATCLKKVGQ